MKGKRGRKRRRGGWRKTLVDVATERDRVMERKETNRKK